MPAAAPSRAAALRRSANVVVPPALVVLALTATYFATLQPGLGFDDTAELQAKAATWELPHETGYPSWLLLAQPFRWLPSGDVAWCTNVYSAVCAVLACTALYGAARELALSRLAAVAGALAFGWSATFWSQAVVAEVYALNAACIAATTWLAASIVRRERPVLRWLLPAVTGIGAGNHLAFLLFLPLVAAWLLIAMRRARRASLVGPALLHVAVHGACFALLCTMVARQRGGTTVDVLAGAWHHATGGQFHGIVTGLPVADLARRMWHWLQLALRELQPLGVVLAAAGLLLPWRGLWLVLLASIAVNVASVARFLVPDVEVFLLPTWLALALLLARGFDRAQHAAARWLPAHTPAHARAAVAAACGVPLAALLLAPAVVRNLPRNDRSGDVSARTFAEAVLAAAAPDALVIAEWRTATPLWYVQRIEGRRTDLAVDVRAWRDLARLVDAAPRDRTVYVTAPDDVLRRRVALRPVGPLFEVVRDPDARAPAGGK